MSFAYLLIAQASLSGLPADEMEGCAKSDTGPVALASCYSERQGQWEERLRLAYPIALAHTEGKQRTALVRAQNAWLSYRDRTCEFYQLEPGSIHYIRGAYCMLDLTRRRTIELEDYVKI